MSRPISSKVDPERAFVELGRVTHERFQNAIGNRWKLEPDGQPTVQSICWLYCWAKTGMQSQEAAAQAQAAFNAIFDKNYDWFDARISHTWAQWARYQGGDLWSSFNRSIGEREVPSRVKQLLQDVEATGEYQDYSPLRSFSKNDVIMNKKYGIGLVISAETGEIRVQFSGKVAVKDSVPYSHEILPASTRCQALWNWPVTLCKC